MPNPRLFVDQPLAAGAQIALGEAEARYLGTVLRLPPGGEVRLFNGADGEWRAEIVRLDKKGAALAVRGQTRAHYAPPDLVLLFAPVKRHATDLIVEKATELGVAALRPVLTRRTIAETVRVDRLQTIAREAAEQTERVELPRIEPPAQLARALDGWDGRPLLYADEAGDDPSAPWGGQTGRGAPLAETLAGLRNAPRLALLTGPEGGFDPEERRMLRSLPFVRPVSLGPRILRAETAAMAALTLVQALWGDWG